MTGALPRQFLALATASIATLILALTPAAGQSPSNPEPSLTRAQIAAVQSQLAALGYEPGPVDGRLGPRTRAAIDFYQRIAGLEPTGEITAELADSLSDELLRDEPIQPDNESDFPPPAPRIR